MFTTPYAKEIPLAWAEVETLTTETPQWVKLSSGEYVSAKFVPRDDGIYLESETFAFGAAAEAVELALMDDYDNLPADDREKNDFKYFVQLGYKL